MPSERAWRDDVVHGEEVRLVAQLLDQLELVIDRRSHGAGGAVGPAPALAFRRQLAQPARRRFAVRHDLARILVAQLVERESDSVRRSRTWPRATRRIDLVQALERAQVTLAVRIQRVARAIDRRAEPRRRQHVLQRAPAAHVHVHVARRDQRQTELGHRAPAARRGGDGPGRSSAVPRRSTALREQICEPPTVQIVGACSGSQSARQSSRTRAALAVSAEASVTLAKSLHCRR